MVYPGSTRTAATPIQPAACSLSPRHAEIFKTAEQESATGTNRYIYRNFAGGTLEPDPINNGA